MLLSSGSAPSAGAPLSARDTAKSTEALSARPCCSCPAGLRQYVVLSIGIPVSVCQEPRDFYGTRETTSYPVFRYFIKRFKRLLPLNPPVHMCYRAINQSAQC